MPRLAATVVMLLFAGSAPADQPARKPWQWTLEERLARRFDPAHIRERERVYVIDHPQIAHQPFIEAQTAPDPPGLIRYGIDGRRNPELFLPHELFDDLMTAFMPDEELRGKQRWLYGMELRALGFDEAQFWTALETAASSYLAVKYPVTNAPDAGSEAAWRRECRLRFEALQAARNSIGGFDTVLYTVAAPWSQLGSASQRDEAARLRAEAAGCR